MSQPKPPTYDAVTPVLRPLNVETADGPGQAIALAYTGKEMIYLVAFDDRAPEWVGEGEVLRATVA